MSPQTSEVIAESTGHCSPDQSTQHATISCTENMLACRKSIHLVAVLRDAFEDAAGLSGAETCAAALASQRQALEDGLAAAIEDGIQNFSQAILSRITDLSTSAESESLENAEKLLLEAKRLCLFFKEIKNAGLLLTPEIERASELEDLKQQMLQADQAGDKDAFIQHASSFSCLSQAPIVHSCDASLSKLETLHDLILRSASSEEDLFETCFADAMSPLTDHAGAELKSALVTLASNLGAQERWGEGAKVYTFLAELDENLQNPEVVFLPPFCADTDISALLPLAPADEEIDICGPAATIDALQAGAAPESAVDVIPLSEAEQAPTEVGPEEAPAETPLSPEAEQVESEAAAEGTATEVSTETGDAQAHAAAEEPAATPSPPPETAGTEAGTEAVDEAAAQVTEGEADQGPVLPDGPESPAQEEAVPAPAESRTLGAGELFAVADDCLELVEVFLDSLRRVADPATGTETVTILSGKDERGRYFAGPNVSQIRFQHSLRRFEREHPGQPAPFTQGDFADYRFYAADVEEKFKAFTAYIYEKLPRWIVGNKADPAVERFLQLQGINPACTMTELSELINPNGLSLPQRMEFLAPLLKNLLAASENEGNPAPSEEGPNPPAQPTPNAETPAAAADAPESAAGGEAANGTEAPKEQSPEDRDDRNDDEQQGGPPNGTPAPARGLLGRLRGIIGLGRAEDPAAKAVSKGFFERIQERYDRFFDFTFPEALENAQRVLSNGAKKLAGVLGDSLQNFAKGKSKTLSPAQRLQLRIDSFKAMENTSVAWREDRDNRIDAALKRLLHKAVDNNMSYEDIQLEARLLKDRLCDDAICHCDRFKQAAAGVQHLRGVFRSGGEAHHVNWPTMSRGSDFKWYENVDYIKGRFQDFERNFAALKEGEAARRREAATAHERERQENIRIAKSAPYRAAVRSLAGA